MGDSGAPGHDIGVEQTFALPGQFQHAVRFCQQIVEAALSVVVDQAGAIVLSTEWKDRMQLKSQVQPDLRRDLIGPVCERRNHEILRGIR